MYAHHSGNPLSLSLSPSIETSFTASLLSPSVPGPASGPALSLFLS